MKTLFMLFLLFFVSSVSSQTMKTKVRGVFHEINSKQEIKEVAVFLIQNSDTIERSCTDSKGHFEFIVSCSAENDYSIGYIYNGTKYRKLPFAIMYDSIDQTEYYFELGIFTQSESKKHELSEFYNIGQKEKDSLVDLFWLKQFLDENPIIYLKYRQFVNPKESKRIAKKRYENFMELLEIANIDNSRIILDIEPIVLGEFDLIYDSRSRFSGKVISNPKDANSQ
jgi:hypothetical protein